MVMCMMVMCVVNCSCVSWFVVVVCCCVLCLVVCWCECGVVVWHAACGRFASTHRDVLNVLTEAH